MPLFLIFIIIPLIEISLFVTLGEEIGLVSTLLLCVVTAFIGATLVRKQGLQTISKAQSRAEVGQIPLEQIFDGFCICIAGVTLITPGFFTDAIGFILLVPTVRKAIIERAKKGNFKFQTGGFSYTNPNDGVIDGEFEEIDDNKSSNNDDQPPEQLK